MEMFNGLRCSLRRKIDVHAPRILLNICNQNRSRVDEQKTVLSGPR